MASFKAGWEWHISLDAPLINKVRKECGVDLVDGDGKSYQRLSEDPVLLVDVLWVLCRKQAETHNVTDEAFGALLVGDPIEAATAALLEAITDFFPTRRRELVKAVAAKNAEIRDKATERALAKINDQELVAKSLAVLEEQMDAELRRVLTGLRNATGSPVSLALAPTDSPSES